MTQTRQRGSATIHELPTRLRPSAANRCTEPRPAFGDAAPKVVEATTVSGWYHEAAIQEMWAAKR